MDHVGQGAILSTREPFKMAYLHSPSATFLLPMDQSMSSAHAYADMREKLIVRLHAKATEFGKARIGDWHDVLWGCIDIAFKACRHMCRNYAPSSADSLQALRCVRDRVLQRPVLDAQSLVSGRRIDLEDLLRHLTTLSASWG